MSRPRSPEISPVSTLRSTWKSLNTAFSRMDVREIAPYLLRNFGIVKKQQWCRVVMDIETRKLVDALDKSSLNVLEISGRKWEALNEFKSYRAAAFPEFDICAKPLAERFDLVIAEQVWEHLLNPLQATKNAYSMLNEGGSLLLTTPFLVRIHEEPHDCTRWSESGLRGLLVQGGFQAAEVTTGSWGNRKCLAANLSQWVPYNRLTHSLKNESDVPLVVWAIARKHAPK